MQAVKKGKLQNQRMLVKSHLNLSGVKRKTRLVNTGREKGGYS